MIFIYKVAIYINITVKEAQVIIPNITVNNVFTGYYEVPPDQSIQHALNADETSLKYGHAIIHIFIFKYTVYT